MRAQVVGLELDITEVLGGKAYQGHAITYQGEPYQGRVKDPVRRFIFGNQVDLVQAVKSLQVGDWVDLEFVSKGKYKNLSSITKASNSRIATPYAEYTSGAAKPAPPPQDDKAESIARAVALKAGIDLVTAAANNGGLTAANLKKPEYLTECVIGHAYRLLPFLLNKDKEDVVEGGALPWEEVPQEHIGD